MNKITKVFSDLFKTKRVLMLVSLLLSFLIWYSLTIYYNPVSTRTIKNVPIMFNTSETAISGMGLEIVSTDIDSVDVVITGKTANVQKATAADITITPSVSYITVAGEYAVALNYSKAMMSDFNIISISPDTVKLKVDAVTSRDFSVIATATGATAEDGLVCETPIVTDSAYRTVTVSGAHSVIEKISKVTARAEVNATLNETTEYEANIILLDEDGQEIDKSGLTLSFDSTMVTVPISKIKNVDVNVVLNNAPANIPLEYTLDVSNVSIIGSPKLIDEITGIDLLPIDFGQITSENNEFECKINLPAGIKVNDGLETVTVKFKFENVRSKVVKVKGLNYTDFDSSIGTVELNSPLSVTVYGTRADIDKITGDNLSLNVSLSDYDAVGSYTVPATVSVSNDFASVWVSTYNKDYSAYITIK